jgi:hypothetical protein
MGSVLQMPPEDHQEQYSGHDALGESALFEQARHDHPDRLESP